MVDKSQNSQSLSVPINTEIDPTTGCLTKQVFLNDLNLQMESTQIPFVLYAIDFVENGIHQGQLGITQQLMIRDAFFEVVYDSMNQIVALHEESIFVPDFINRKVMFIFTPDDILRELEGIVMTELSEEKLIDSFFVRIVSTEVSPNDSLATTMARIEYGFSKANTTKSSSVTISRVE